MKIMMVLGLLLATSPAVVLPVTAQESGSKPLSSAIPPTAVTDANTSPLSPFFGTWTGTWRGRGDAVGDLILVLGPEGATVQATGAPNFGSKPVSATLTLEKGGDLSYSAIGADGNVFSCTLESNSKRTQLQGWGTFRSNSIRVELRK